MLLIDKKSAGLLTDDDQSRLEGLKIKKIKLEKNLKIKEDEQERQQKHREKMKQAKQLLIRDIPEAGKYDILTSLFAQ